MKHPLMQFFVYAHLPAHLAEASKPFCELAEKLEAMNTIERLNSGYQLIDGLKLAMQRELRKNSESDWTVQKLHEARDMAIESYGLDELLHAVLEAKDCAVRAVLFKAEV